MDQGSGDRRCAEVEEEGEGHQTGTYVTTGCDLSLGSNIKYVFSLFLENGRDPRAHCIFFFFKYIYIRILYCQCLCGTASMLSILHGNLRSTTRGNVSLCQNTTLGSHPTHTAGGNEAPFDRKLLTGYGRKKGKMCAPRHLFPKMEQCTVAWTLID